MVLRMDELMDFLNDISDDIRVYAPYFALSPDRQGNESDVASILGDELAEQDKASFHSLVSRGQGDDPPDCEALDENGNRVGIEVTELVDGASIADAKRAAKAAANRRPIVTAIEDDAISQKVCTPSDLIKEISDRVLRKSRSEIHGGPYGTYLLIIYCDDPLYLDYDNFEAVRRARFDCTGAIDRVYFLTSYLPWEQRCPLIELQLHRVSK